MNLKDYYYYFKSVLPKSFCDRILKKGKKLQSKLGTIGDPTVNLKDYRNSNVSWMDDKWIYKKIHPFIHYANHHANWNFDWDYSESCQFTKYNKNQFYDWHCDTFPEPHNNPKNLNFHGKIRKLSVTVSLSDSKDYEGGELEFQFRNQKDPSIKTKCLEILPLGSLVVFPSFVWHRVKPITKGTRYSLVMWNLGYPFK